MNPSSKIIPVQAEQAPEVAEAAPQQPLRSLRLLRREGRTSGPQAQPTEDAVGGALWADDLLRNLEYGHIAVTIDGGTAILQGHVTGARTRRLAERAARMVPGVQAVENRLVADDDLVNQVCAALVEDPRTTQEIILVAGAARGDHAEWECQQHGNP